MGSLTYEPTVATQDLTILLFQLKDLSIATIRSGVATVDFTIGRELTFRVEYTTKSYVESFFVVSPSGSTYTDVVYDDSNKPEFIVIPGIAEEGDWIFYLTLGSSKNDYVNIIVTSKAKTNSSLPITVECYVPSGSVVQNAAVEPVQLDLDI